MPATLHTVLPVTLASAAAARQAVREFLAGAAVEEDDVDGIVLAVSEAVANVLVHAYADGVRGTVELAAETSGDEVAISVCDHGRGLSAPGRRARTGLGLPLIARLAHRVELDDTPSGVTLRMRFRRGETW